MEFEHLFLQCSACFRVTVVPFASEETVRKALRKCRYSFKRVLDVPVGRNSPEVIDRRYEYALDMDAFRRAVIYVDKAPYNLHTGRKYGWARIGQRGKLTRTESDSSGRNKPGSWSCALEGYVFFC